MAARNRASRIAFVAAALGSLVLAAPVCVPDLDTPAGGGEPPETAFLPSCDTGAFCWSGSDTDGQVSGFQAQLLQVDATYYASGGASGATVAWILPALGEGWTQRDDWTSIRPAVGPGTYALRVRAVDDDGNPDPTPAEVRWREARPQALEDHTRPAAMILSGCGRLYPDPSRLVVTCDASDIGADQRLTPRTELEYRYFFWLSFDMGGGECPGLAGAPGWTWSKFPADPEPIEIVFEDPGYELAPLADCRFEFMFEVRDPAGNVDETICWIVVR